MKDFRLRTIATLLCLFCAAADHAQQPQPTAAVPKLVRFSGSFRPANGTPAQSVESVTLAVYRDQTGGNALWQEVQNVAVDADGRYSLLMGATQNEGMPLDLFSSGEPRWLSAQFNRPGEAEQPRVLLVSVPYALKASDAETLGGRPASAYLLATPTIGTGTHESVTAAATSVTTPVKPKATPLNSGMPNFIGKFTNTTDLIDSSMYEVGGNVGISTVTPLISLDVRTGSLPQMGIAGTTDYLTFFASDVFGPAIYWDPAKDMRFGKGGASLYNPFGFVEQMRIQSSTGNVGIGTMTPGSKLDVAGDISLIGSLEFGGSPILRLPGDPPAQNLAVGLFALQNNTTGRSNTASGYAALQNNTIGAQNTAIGYSAMLINTTGGGNTAIGSQTLWENTSGGQNTAYGIGTLGRNTTGSSNLAIGVAALEHNIDGNNNIAIGYQAATNVLPSNSNNIHIGSIGLNPDNGTIRIGDSTRYSSFFTAGVRGVTTGSNDAIPVMVDSAGQLGTVSSSRRFKEDIEDMGAASHDLMRLRPVTYRYKQPFSDGSKPIQYGLIAEEVAEVYPDLVAHSADGQIETVKYQVLDSMLLNEVQRQQAEIGGQKNEIRRLEDRLVKLEAALARVSSVQ